MSVLCRTGGTAFEYDHDRETGRKGEGKCTRYRLIDLVDRLPVPQGRHQWIFRGPGEATELLTAK